MYHPKLQITVSVSQSERRTYTDRTTGQTREYLSSVLSGITDDFSTMVKLRVPDNLAGILNSLNPGDRVAVALDSYDCRRGGVAEGSVCEIERA